MSDIDFQKLAEPFPAEAIHWRAQNLTKDGSKALALAYLDSRDVQDRLDDVCGPANWQDRYEFHGSRTVCYLSVRVGDEWITKADGAGDSAVEAEKGSISDALKRAAVKWGIGRYLYDLGDTWVPCESTDYQGKKRFKKFTADPWQSVRNSARFLPANSNKPKAKPAPIETATAEPTMSKERADEIAEALIGALEYSRNVASLESWGEIERANIQALPKPQYERVVKAFKARKGELLADEPVNVLEAG